MAQPTNQTDLTRQLADFVAQTSYDDLPSEVVEQAKLFILDTLGCALGGRIQAKEEVSWVTGFATDQKAAGQSTIFGEATKTNAVTSAMQAALALARGSGTSPTSTILAAVQGSS